ncbi:MAG: phage regulatory protein/antirepressor Ant [Lachnospiraceae bacterium]|nr:phage regulatory protein/antirepressor Ant [Lachnospiraceae bacterium]
MSSLQIAEITGKQHAHIMRDIRTLIEQGCTESNFGLSEYKDSTGRVLPCYQLTKKGCLILASGYNAKLREKIIDRWEELENGRGLQTTQLSRKELAMMVVQAEEERERLSLENTQKTQEIERQQETITRQEETIKVQAPKVNYYDTTLQSVNTLTTTQIAKELGMDAPKLNKKLKEAGVIFRQSGMWMLRQPYSAWNLAATRTQTYTRSDGSTGTSVYTVWNQRGRRFIHAMHESGFNTKSAVKMITASEA